MSWDNPYFEEREARNDLYFEESGTRGEKPGSLLADAEKDAKQQAFFMRKNRKFHCVWLDKTTTPDQCANFCNEDCTFQRTAAAIFELSAKNTASRGNSVDHSQFNFHTYNPRRISKTWAPSAPGISLTKNVLYINTEAIKQFSLGAHARVALLFDSLNNAVLLDFSEDHPDHIKLRVTHRKGGDAKVSLVGFRKDFGVEQQGKFRMKPFGEEDRRRFLVLLDENTAETAEEALP